MSRWRVTLIIAVILSFHGVAHAIEICKAHQPGSMPGNLSGTASIKPNTKGWACVSSANQILEFLCEVGQDGPNHTFDGPYACGPSLPSQCYAASQQPLDSLVVDASSYVQLGDGRWQACIHVVNYQQSTWRYVGLVGTSARRRIWWGNRHKFKPAAER